MAQKLKIRRVVLYKHGVGYFERRGEVTGSDVVDLEFKSRDMNDVLKSLTVLDLSGGTVSAVSYDSTRPLEKLLEDAAVRIPDADSLTALVTQIKGARVRARLGAESLEGTVLGVERVQHAQGDAVVTRTHLCLFVDGAVRAAPLLELRDLTLLDASVRGDVEYYLATVLSSHKKDARRVSVFATGDGAREVFVSYVLEAPVWKTSYRALLVDEGAPVLQGWALVDNVSDEDWEDVDLALVAGLPVSFRHDLYSPRYMQRPEVEVKTEAAAAPVIPEEAFGAMGGGGPPPPPSFGAPGMAPPQPAAAPAPMRARAAPTGAARAEAMAASARVTTVVKDVGDLFEYRIARPVTVRRNQSALVPILQRPMGGARVLLYNRATRERNPMACIELTNTSELTLEGGPLTVTEGDLYVGEAMLDTMKPGDRRLVPYAVELGCVVAVEVASESGPVFRAVVAHGQLTTEAWMFRRTRHRVRLKGTRRATLFVEHPKADGWELTDTPAPAETTERAWRFRLALEPGAEVTFTVTERYRTWSHTALGNVTDDDVKVYVSSRYIDARVAAALRDVVQLRARASEHAREAQRLTEERDAITRDQERIRLNLGVLAGGADREQIAERLVRKLGQQEDRLEELVAALDRATKDRAALDREVNERLLALSATVDLGQA